MSDLGAVVLCGGRSSRMGSSKAWLDFDGEPLLARVVVRLAQVADPIVVVAAPGQALPPLSPAATIVRDPVEGQGPLVAIAAGLAALDGRVRRAYVTSTDAPFVVPAFVARLCALAGDHDICAPSDGVREQPLAAVYAPELHTVAAALVAGGSRRALDLLARARTRVVGRAELLADPALAAADPELRSLRSLNTPEEYAAALRELG